MSRIDAFREGIDIDGRPDIGRGRIKEFGQTRVRKFMPYIHSASRQACLIHKVTSVTARWYEPKGSWLQRRDTPFLIATTACGQSISLSGAKAGKMCEIPDPNAVLCGTCHGELPTFSRRRIYRIKRQWAKDHLGCKGIDEVLGPYIDPLEIAVVKTIID